jgi:nucleoside-diphosphate-sugar epimerase
LEISVMSSDLVLVTGASGYVAGHCMLRLLHDGYRVRGTLRSLQRADEVRQWLTKARGGIDPGDTLSFVEVELTNSNGWDAAMEGVRYVLHVASPIPSSMPKNPDDLIVPAREGTLNVMRAASRASVQRVVQTSSLSAIFHGRDDPNSPLHRGRLDRSDSVVLGGVVVAVRLCVDCAPLQLPPAAPGSRHRTLDEGQRILSFENGF